MCFTDPDFVCGENYCVKNCIASYLSTCVTGVGLLGDGQGVRARHFLEAMLPLLLGLLVDGVGRDTAVRLGGKTLRVVAYIFNDHLPLCTGHYVSKGIGNRSVRFC